MPSPMLVRSLTLTGATPFVVFALCLAFEFFPIGSQTGYINLYVTYSVVILSFLAGIHWGLAIASECYSKLLISSNIVALLAWLILMLNHFLIVIPLLIFGFVLQWSIDYILMKHRIIRSWYFNLRTLVSLIVILTLLLVLISIK